MTSVVDVGAGNAPPSLFVPPVDVPVGALALGEGLADVAAGEDDVGVTELEGAPSSPQPANSTMTTAADTQAPRRIASSLKRGQRSAAPIRSAHAGVSR
jgi:hypothetical protein